MLTKINKSFSLNLDILRTIAAALVMISHLRGHYFLAYNDLAVTSQNIVNTVLFFSTQLGGEAVVIFFVLSGYLVGGTSLVPKNLATFSFKRYTIDRLSRMWTVLIPVLFISMGIAYLNFGLLGNVNDLKNVNINAFLGNLFFTQQVFCPTFASNSPLWSLTYEVWYYFVWAAFVYAIQHKKKKYYIIPLFATIVMCLLSTKVTILFPIWLLGVFLRFIPRINIRYQSVLVCGACIQFLFALAISSLIRDDKNLAPTSYMVGFSFAVFLYTLQYWDKQLLPKTIFGLVSWKKLASFSFTMYAIHYVFQHFIYSLIKNYLNPIIPIRVANANCVQWLYLLMITTVIVFLSYLVYLISEKHTLLIRNYCYKIFKI